MRLVQMDGMTDKEHGITGVKCIKPHGIFHKLHMLYNFGAFFLKTVFSRKDVVICVGKPMLTLCGLYQVVFRSKLIWYSLEFSKLGLLNRFVYRKCVTGYIDVEENRRGAIFARYGRKANSIVCYNMPHLNTLQIKGGRLRAYLKDRYKFSGKEKLVVYAGSYQKYARVETIVEASRAFPPTIKLVVMAYGLPEDMKAVSNNCYVVPPVRGEEFYEWLSDASCALLPYEDESDFNVCNCSPQKLFDCFVVGVPFVASNRPIINKILAKIPSAGIVGDFTDAHDICIKVASMTSHDDNLKLVMQAMHRTQYNYDKMHAKIAKLIEDVYA